MILWSYDLMILFFYFIWTNCSSSGDRIIDVGSEWRTFSNKADLKDPSRVGHARNPLLNGEDLSTRITGAARFDEFGNSKYQNRRTLSRSDQAMLNAFKEISTMADRINLPISIIVSSCPCSLHLVWFRRYHNTHVSVSDRHVSVSSTCMTLMFYGGLLVFHFPAGNPLGNPPT